MDKNEKYLSSWIIYFLESVDFKNLKIDMNSFILNRFLEDKANYIFLKKIKNKIKKDKKIYAYLVKNNDFFETQLESTNDTNFLISSINDALKFKNRYFMIEVLNIYKNEINKNIKFRKIKCDYSKKIDELAKLFKLNECEKKLLIFFYLRQTDNDFSSFFEERHIRSLGSLSKIVQSSISDLILAFNYESPIKKYLLKNNHYECFDLNNFVLSYFTNNKNPKDFFYNEFKGYIFDLNTFAVEKNEISLINNILTNKETGSNILFYGPPGTGKTELAKSIARSINKNIYFINEENSENSVKKRLASIIACEGTIDTDKSIIIVDEADSILDTFASHLIRGENIEKAFINKFLEKKESKIIWIINNSLRIELSILRRFDFSIHLKNISNKHRFLLWNNILSQKKMDKIFNKDEIFELSELYKVNAGGIALAVNAIAPIKDKYNHKILKEKIEQVLKNFKELTEGSFLKEIKNNSINYSLEGLNTDVDLNSIIDILKSFKNCKVEGIRNMNLLLSGVSGSGKTEFVRYIARELELELVTKTASQLLSSYIGETESNIRKVFNQAQEQEAILFIDEADSFLFPREFSQRSWEITITNEMLCQIEAFEGIFICATNFFKHLDTASIRRFNLKVNFDYLDENGKLSFYKKIFNNLIKETFCDEYLKKELFKINYLSPGDFKIAFQKNFYLKNIGHEKILQDLKIESNSKQHSLSKKISLT